MLRLTSNKKAESDKSKVAAEIVPTFDNFFDYKCNTLTQHERKLIKANLIQNV